MAIIPIEARSHGFDPQAPCDRTLSSGQRTPAQDWYIQFVVNFHCHDRAGYDRCDEEVGGYCEACYPKMNEARRKAEGLLGTATHNCCPEQSDAD